VAGLIGPDDTVHYRIFHPARQIPPVAPTSYGIVPADRTSAPWPVVILMPGINVDPDGYRWLAVELAEVGIAAVTYALVGEIHHGVIGITPGIDESAFDDRGGTRRPGAVALGPLLAALADQNADGLLGGTLDLDHVLVAGHAAGGAIALQSANRSWFAGVTGCLVYAGRDPRDTEVTTTPSPLAASGGLPTLLVSAQLDVESDPSEPLTTTFQDALAAGRGDCYHAVLAGATSASILWPEDDTTGPGYLEPAPGRDPRAIRGDLARAIIGFVDAHVRAADERTPRRVESLWTHLSSDGFTRAARR
jgi:dienelactone hydrolase